MAVFQGFSSELIDFLWELRMNNSKEWMEKNRNRYKEVMKEPFDEFSKELAEAFLGRCNRNMDWSVSRVNRDIRFSKDKSPYRTNRWVVLREKEIKNAEAGKERPAFYFDISPEGYEFGMGFYGASTGFLEQYRKKIESNPSAFWRVAKKMEKLAGYEIRGDEYKRMKADGLDQKILPWYRKKSISVSRAFELDDVVFSAGLIESVVQGWMETMPLYEYLISIKAE